MEDRQYCARSDRYEIPRRAWRTRLARDDQPGLVSSRRRRDRGPQAEPLLGVPGLKPLNLGEPELCREAHRTDVGALGGEHHWLAGQDGVEPLECRRARLGGVPESPCPSQEQIAEVG